MRTEKEGQDRSMSTVVWASRPEVYIQLETVYPTLTNCLVHDAPTHYVLLCPHIHGSGSVCNQIGTLWYQKAISGLVEDFLPSLE